MKTALWIIGILVLLLVGVGIYLSFNSGALVKRVIESYGPDYLGADVTVDSVGLKLTEGAGTVRGLTVGNPAGFPGAYAMHMGELTVEVDPLQISKDLIVIKRIRVDGAELAAVLKGPRETNFQALLDNVTRAVGDAADSSSTADSGPRIIIDALDFTNTKTSLSSDILGHLVLDIPDIRLTNIGRDTGGATASAAIQQILTPLTQAITREALNRGINLDQIKEDARQKVQQSVKDKLDGGLKKLTDKFGIN